MFFKSIVLYIKEYLDIKDVFYGQDFKNVIMEYLHISLDKDWIGRLYGVINPNIDINGNFNITNMIIEIDGENTNNNDYVKNWIYKQLNMMGRLFNMKRLYEHINMTITHVGPMNDDNYLVVFDMVGRINMAQRFKSMFKHLFIYIILAVVVILGYLNFI